LQRVKKGPETRKKRGGLGLEKETPLEIFLKGIGEDHPQEDPGDAALGKGFRAG